MGNKKILLITTSFYPQNKISVLRMGQWAKYWNKNGYDVTVLTTKKYDFLDSLTLNVKLPLNIKIIEIDFLPFFFRSLRKDNSSNKIKSNKIIEQIKFKVRKLRNYIGSFYDIHDFWISKATKVGLDLMESKEFTYIVSSYSPAASHVVAKKIKKKHPNVFWIADFRDLWAFNHLQKGIGFFSFLEKKKERNVLRRVNRILTVSDPLTHEMRLNYPNKDVLTVENGFDLDEFPNWKEDIKGDRFLNKKILITYAGTIYLGKRDPTILIEALNELIDDCLLSKEDIKVEFYTNSKNELNQILSNNNLNRYEIAKVKGYVSREVSLKVQKNSDFLLFLEWNHFSARGVLTGKLFEYLVSGVPIISIGVNSDFESGKLIENSGTGLNFTNKEDVKKMLLKVIIERKIEFYSPDEKLIECYSREKQSLRIFDNIR